MASGLAWSGVKVVDQDGQVVAATGNLLVRQNRAQLRRRGVLLADRVDVVAVDRTARQVRTVTFADGSSWTVSKQGCGCGT